MNDVHRQCWELLPWIANERASAKDAARVDAHLIDCEECREELLTQRRLREAIRSAEPVVIAPQTSLQKLLRQIDGEDSKIEHDDASRAPATTRRRRDVLSSRWWPIAACIQGVALIGLLGALWWQSQDELTAPRFTTLTTPTAVTHGPAIRVVFAEGMTLDAMTGMLRAIDAQIVAGPSEAGVYTLGLTPAGSETTSIDQALAQLRSDKRVLFAESAIARSEQP